MEKDVKNKILILFAHPVFQRSKFNKNLINGIKNLDGVTINDLYEHYPDFLIDVQREQQLLKEHSIIVFHHPLYWYSSPAILKEWQDTVLEMGFAYGTNGNALSGKKLLSVITTSSINSFKNNKIFREYLFPFEQTAIFCKMEYLPPLILQNTSKINVDSDISRNVDLYKRTLISLIDNVIDFDKLQSFDYINENFMQN